MRRLPQFAAFWTDDAMADQALQLDEMMKPYKGPRHTVVASHLRDGRCDIVGSGPNETEAPWDDLIFEIGSITKVFTAILLCVLVEEGKIDPRAPLSEMSGTLKDVPHWITPERLVSHTSGLPNIYAPIWKALFQQQPEGPYANFTRADLLTWVRNWRGKDPGTNLRHGYSNLGYGLLGEAMAMMVGKTFAELLAAKVIHPFGLHDTTGKLSDAQRTRFMQPIYPSGKAATPWTFDALAGAGTLRSSARDLARFSGAVFRAFNAPETSLDRAIRRSTHPLFGLGSRGSMEPTAQCHGWLSVKRVNSEPTLVLANGGTAGSTCALYLCPERSQAVSILSNNGVAANLWASAKLSWSNPLQQAQDLLAGSFR